MGVTVVPDVLDELPEEIEPSTTKLVGGKTLDLVNLDADVRDGQTLLGHERIVARRRAPRQRTYFVEMPGTGLLGDVVPIACSVAT